MKTRTIENSRAKQLAAKQKYQAGKYYQRKIVSINITCMGFCANRAW